MPKSWSERNQTQKGVKGFPAIPVEQRFWDKVNLGQGDACWEWQATRSPNGYGQVSADGRLQAAHRVAWQLTYGPIPEGLKVLHRCDNRPCVRPAHLWLGTQSDNMRDCVTKGRHTSQQASTARAGQTILTVLVDCLADALTEEGE